jgi:acyl carrier protein
MANMVWGAGVKGIFSKEPAVHEQVVIAKVREFIAQNFLHAHPGVELTDDYRLLERRLLDSMAIMEVIEYIEDEFGIVVDERDIVEANLETLRAIGAYVGARVEAAA